MLTDVVFLAEDLRRTAGRSGPLEPAERFELISLLMRSQGHEKSAQEKRTFRITQGSAVVPEAIRVGIRR